MCVYRYALSYRVWDGHTHVQVQVLTAVQDFRMHNNQQHASQDARHVSLGNETWLFLANFTLCYHLLPGCLASYKQA